METGVRRTLNIARYICHVHFPRFTYNVHTEGVRVKKFLNSANFQYKL